VQFSLASQSNAAQPDTPVLECRVLDLGGRKQQGGY